MWRRSPLTALVLVARDLTVADAEVAADVVDVVDVEADLLLRARAPQVTLLAATLLALRAAAAVAVFAAAVEDAKDARAAGEAAAAAARGAVAEVRAAVALVVAVAAAALPVAATEVTAVDGSDKRECPRPTQLLRRRRLARPLHLVTCCPRRCLRLRPTSERRMHHALMHRKYVWYGVRECGKFFFVYPPCGNVEWRLGGPAPRLDCFD